MVELGVGGARGGCVVASGGRDGVGIGCGVGGKCGCGMKEMGGRTVDGPRL